MSSVVFSRNAMYADNAKTEDTDGGRGWTQGITHRVAGLACGSFERELARARHEHQAVREQLEEREAQAEAAAVQLGKLGTEVSTLGAQLEEREAQAEATAVQLAKLGTEVNALGAQLEERDAQAEAAAVQIGKLEVEVSTLGAQLEERDAQAEAAAVQIGKLGAEVSTLDAEVSRLTVELKAEKRQTMHLSSMLLSDTVAEQRLLEQAKHSEAQLEQLQLEVSRLSALLDQEMAEKSLKEVDNCALVEQLDLEKEELARARMDLKYQTKLLHEKGDEFDDLAKQLAQTMVEVDTSKMQLAKLSEELLRKDADAIRLQGQLELAEQQHVQELAALKTSLAEKEHDVATLGAELAGNRTHADGLSVQIDDLREQLAQTRSELKVEADRESMRAEDFASQLLCARDALSQAFANLNQKATFAEDVSQQLDQLHKHSEQQNVCNKQLAQERWSWELTSQLLVSQLKQATDQLGECRRECCELSGSLEGKEAEIQVVSHKLVEAGEESEVLKSSLRRMRDENAVLEQQSAELAVLQQLFLQKAMVNEDLASQLSASAERLIKCRGECCRLQEDLGMKEAEVRAVSQQLAEAEVAAATLSNSLEQLRGENFALEQQSAQLATELLQKAMGSEDLAGQLRVSTEELMKCRGECCRLQEDLGMKESQVRDVSQQLAEAEVATATLKNCLEQLRGESSVLEQQSAQFASELLQKTMGSEDLAGQLRASTEELVKCRGECCRLQEDLGMKEAEIRAVSQRLAEADAVADALKISLEQLANESEASTTRLLHELSQKAMGNEDLAGQLRVSTRQLRDCREECSNLNEVLKGKEAEIQAASKDMAEARVDVHALRSSLEQEREANSRESVESARLQHELEGQLEVFTEQLAACKRKCSELSDDLLNKEGEIQAASKKLVESEVGAEALKSCLEQLREEYMTFANQGVETAARLQDDLAQKAMCVEDLSGQLGVSLEQLIECRRDCCRLSNLLEGREAEIQAVLAENSAEFAKLQLELAQTTMCSEDIAAQLQASAEHLMECGRECYKLKDVLEVRKADIHAESQKLAESDAHAAALGTCAEHLRHENAAAASESSRSLAQRAMGSTNLAGQLRIFTNQVVQLCNELHTLEEKHSARVDEVDGLTQSLSETQLEKGTLASEISNMRTEVNEARVQNSNLSEELCRLKVAVQEEQTRNDELVRETQSLTQRLEHESKKKEEAAQRCAELICSCPRVNLEAWIGKVRAFHDSSDWQLVTWSGAQETVVMSTLQGGADSELRSDETPCIILNASRKVSRDDQDDHIPVKVCTPPGRKTTIATKGTKRPGGRPALRDEREPIVYDRIMQVLKSNPVVFDFQRGVVGRGRPAHKSSSGSGSHWQPPRGA
eukprot:TRINITY_DN6772_c0_g1_i1.p1 TRINITY_DN6772_c0_g1~~TRINITY_DN6772_c0_g1_i1.p1  ORF type:complete len:1372 (-),score=380.83 TRINITY_DN6772_c0_g1_i1:51-4166(-)